MKKKLYLIIPILVAFLVFTGVLIYYQYERAKTSFTIAEKRWIENNKNNIIDIEVINNIPIYGINGEGIFFDILNNFAEETSLELNILPYLKENEPTSNKYRIRLLNADTVLSDKDLLIYEDNYVIISKKANEILEIDNIKDETIGTLTNDAGELSYYLKDVTNIKYATYNSIDLLFTALDNGEITMLVIPNILYLDKTIGTTDYYINYHFTEYTKKIVLTLSEDNTILNSIIKKYFIKWKDEYFVDSYNEKLLSYYIERNNINDKTRVDILSKSYIYGYVENSPYEKTVRGESRGIASEYINRMIRLADIEVEYKRFSSVKKLKQAIANKEIDIYFDYYGIEDSNYLNTISTFNEKYAVLAKKNSDYIINTFESLKNKKVNMLNNNQLYNYFKGNSRALIETYNSVEQLVNKNKDIIVVDFEVYNYYHNSKFKNYQLLYVNNFTNEYNFKVLKENEPFYKLFNYIIQTNSYYRYRNTGLNSLHGSLVDFKTFQQAYLIVVTIILIPVIFITGLLLYIGRKKRVKAIKIDDKRKYTDLLTSLKNRNYLNLNIKAWEESTIYPQSIIIIDLNNVKYVNDNYGHEAGDKLIIAAASILVNNQLENSEIIRTDGNEFLIYLVGYSEQQTTTYTKKLSKEFKELPHGFGAAVGFSMIVDDIKTVDDAINEATLDMHKNKEEYK
ncbi:MAG: diguanylate cyclase [Tenericutes bacterium]|jgi:diguanylate cyclase (GGDEF)-like protein|nr:diguanylate cyclase [Mycoplasmatota bacterium]